jgi:hypothetical protein
MGRIKKIHTSATRKQETRGVFLLKETECMSDSEEVKFELEIEDGSKKEKEKHASSLMLFCSLKLQCFLPGTVADAE